MPNEEPPTKEPAPATVADQRVRQQRFMLFLGVLAVAIIVLLIASAGFGGGSEGDQGASGTTSEPPASTGPATTAAPTTTTEPLRTASPEEPLRILIAGDSLVGWIPTAMTEALAGEPVEIIDDWKGSSGLARPDFFDWPARLAEDAETHDPDVVIVGFGGNDTQNLVVGDQVLQRGTPEWQVEYSRRVGEALDAIEGPGRTLWWIGLPLSDRDNLEAQRDAMTDAFKSNLDSRPWTRYVDAEEILAPDGTYQVYLPGPDGEEIRVRADDGIHPSPGGGRMIVDAFLPEVRAERGL